MGQGFSLKILVKKSRIANIFLHNDTNCFKFVTFAIAVAVNIYKGLLLMGEQGRGGPRGKRIVTMAAPINLTFSLKKTDLSVDSPKCADSDTTRNASCRGGEIPLKHQRRRTIAPKFWIALLAIAIGLSGSLSGCSDRIEAQSPESSSSRSQPSVQLSEVAPPATLQRLRQNLDVYQPQVTILSPQADETVNSTTVEVQLQVQDLPIFKDETLGLGPHLEVILDHSDYQEIYDLNQGIVFQDLEPGTHTLQVFASRPWDESFKNEGAYAQTTFHLFSPTGDNTPDPNQPLLTYNSPQGTYGAEPILLDFYLTNAPLHLVAQEDPDVKDWRIRVTANGRSFIIDTWQALFLEGFKEGQNWLKLELLDEEGNVVSNNAFDSTVKLITYDPKKQDTLARLSRDELPYTEALAIVDPDYVKPVTPVPEVEETPEVEAEPEEEVIEAPVPPVPSEVTESETPEAKEEPESEVIEAPVSPIPSEVTESETPEVEEEPESEVIEAPVPPIPSEVTETETPEVEAEPEASELEEENPELTTPPTTKEVTSKSQTVTEEVEKSEVLESEPPEVEDESELETPFDPEVVTESATPEVEVEPTQPDTEVEENPASASESVETPLEPEESVEIMPQVEELAPETSASEAGEVPNVVETLPEEEVATPTSEATPLEEKAKPKRKFLDRFGKKAE